MTIVDVFDKTVWYKNRFVVLSQTKTLKKCKNKIIVKLWT